MGECCGGHHHGADAVGVQRVAFPRRAAGEVPVSDITAASTVADVLARHPETRAVMERFALNHCCGAHLPLSAAAAAAGAPVETVVAALVEAVGARP